MLYNSALNVPISVVKDYKVPKRPNTSWWEGVHHYDIVKNVRTQAKDRKLKIVDEQYQLGNKGHTLFASWSFDKTVAGAKDIRMAVGYRGSNIGRFAHTFFVGGTVFCCQNGVISGDFIIGGKKHAASLDLPGMIAEAFDIYLEEQKSLLDLKEKLRARKLSNERALELIFQAGHQGLIGGSRTLIVHEHWANSPHKEFKDRNGWSLYNAFTESAKKTTPAQQIQVFREVPDLILNVA